MTDSEGAQNVEQEAAYVEEASVQQENLEPTKLNFENRRGWSRFVYNGFVTSTSLKRHNFPYTSGDSTDTTDSLGGPTPAKQLKLSAANKTFESNGIFMQSEELDRNPDISNWEFLDHQSESDSAFMHYRELNGHLGNSNSVFSDSPSTSDSELLSMAMSSFDSSDNYEADASSLSAEGSPNKSYSSEDETKWSPFGFLPKAPRTSFKGDGARFRDKRKILSKRIMKHGTSCKAQIRSPKPGPSGQSNECKHSSKLMVSSTPIFEGIDESTTLKNDSYFQLSTGEAHNRRLRSKPLAHSISSLESISNTDRALTSISDPNHQLSSSEEYKRHLPPWFMTSSLTGEEIYETRQPSNTRSDQDDESLPRKANMRRLRALLELPTSSKLEISRTDQPSTSVCNRGYHLPLGGPNDTQVVSAIGSSSNSSTDRAYDSDQSTSSWDHDYCIPSEY